MRALLSERATRFLAQRGFKEAHRGLGYKRWPTQHDIDAACRSMDHRIELERFDRELAESQRRTG